MLVIIKAPTNRDKVSAIAVNDEYHVRDNAMQKIRVQQTSVTSIATWYVEHYRYANGASSTLSPVFLREERDRATRLGLDFSNEEIADILARGDADGVVERPVVERGREDVGEAERKHERDPS